VSFIPLNGYDDAATDEWIKKEKEYTALSLSYKEKV